MTSPEVELRRVWHRIAGRRDDSAFEALMGRHREPHRRYHTATHVVWVCRHVDDLVGAHPVPDVEVLLAAALFHDAVYDPTAAAPSNEVHSAALAAHVLGEVGWAAGRVGELVRLVELTAGHEPDHGDVAGAVLVDADLAVLGGDAASYAAYVTGVRAEYSHVDDAAWRDGRAAVLRHFLDRPAIYATPTMRAGREHRARANLSAELATLT